MCEGWLCLSVCRCVIIDLCKFACVWLEECMCVCMMGWGVFVPCVFRGEYLYVEGCVGVWCV